jgi:MFS family permease
MMFGASMLIAVHLLFTFAKVEWNVSLNLFGKESVVNMYIVLMMFILGIAFSLVPAAMWPSVAKIVPESRIGTAYGAMFSLQNLGLFAIPILAGSVLDRTNPGITPEMIESGSASLNYTPTMLIFIACGIVGLIFAFLLKWDDKTSGYGLEYPSNYKEEENEIIEENTRKSE